MLNPFKKKEKEFKLDDYELPNLNSKEENSSSASSFNTSPQAANNIDAPDPFAQPSQTPIQNNNPQQTQSQSFDNAMASATPNTPDSSAFDNPFTKQQQGNNEMPSSQNQSDNSVHNDITKAKLDTMESKISLMDAKLSSIEQKLELLTQMIKEEVSEETKRKLNVKSMMSNIKQ